jgi:hypothetical protein
LTLRQPWAQLVALGEKRIETRRFCYGSLVGHYVAIQASKSFPAADQQLMDGPYFFHVLGRHGITKMSATHQDMPRGTVVAVTTVEDIVLTDSLLDPDIVEFSEYRKLMTDKERAFGDYSPGRWAYILGPVYRMNRYDVFVKGRLGPFDLPDAVAHRVLVGIQWNADLPVGLTDEDLLEEAIRLEEDRAHAYDQLERNLARLRGSRDSLTPVERMIDKAVGR